MVAAVGQSTLGVFCENPSVGIATLGVFCGDIQVADIPTGGGGGGGIGSVSGENYYNQTPPTYRAPNQVSYLAQARQEDEEMLILLRAIVEIIQ